MRAPQTPTQDEERREAMSTVTQPMYPATARLIPCTLPVHCHYNSFCRCGKASHFLARGSARALWIPLGRGCVQSIIEHLPAELHPAGLPATAPAPSGPEAVPADPRQFVLDYLAEHSEDAQLLEAVSVILGGSDDEAPVPATTTEGSPKTRATPQKRKTAGKGRGSGGGKRAARKAVTS